MTRRILPVVGSRSTRAEEGANCLGMALEMASLEVVEVLEMSPARSFSVPPVAELRREVRPRRR